MSTFISCIDECDNFRVKNDPTLVPFYLSSSPAAERQLIGILKPQIIDLLQAHDAQRVASSSAAAFDILLGAGKDSVAFSTSIDTPEKRSAVMRDLGHHWRDQGLFAEVLGGRLWRNELYAVRASPFRGWTPDAPPAFMMERVVCALFGIVTYGVHLSCYTADYRVWVPRRAKTKQTWPGYLDNTVAGGIPAGMTPFESILKEAMEEASLSEAFVRQHIRAVGAVTYLHQTPLGWLQPEVQYVYDLCIPDGANVVPNPHDDEVESFELCTIDDIKQKMLAGLFKPNCALVLVDFMIRHGLLTAENEPNFLEITTRLHGRFDWDEL